MKLTIYHKIIIGFSIVLVLPMIGLMATFMNIKALQNNNRARQVQALKQLETILDEVNISKEETNTETKIHNVSKALDKIFNVMETEFGKRVDANQKRLEVILKINIVLLIITVVLAIMISALITRSVSMQIKHVFEGGLPDGAKPVDEGGGKQEQAEDWLMNKGKGDQ